jgi:hypothetical protein
LKVRFDAEDAEKEKGAEDAEKKSALHYEPLRTYIDVYYCALRAL